MKLGHILYKVDDLDSAVRDFRRKGFNVEYGKKKNPYNALVYFSEGPYLELFHYCGMPKAIKRILRFFGSKYLIDRLDIWDQSREGLIGVALESDKFDLIREQRILNKANVGYFKGRSGRTDTKGRKLRFQGVMPDNMEIPFFGTKFNINTRPEKGFIHPNGIRCIKNISFGTKKEFIPVIQQLTDDNGLKLFIGEGVRNLEFDYANDDNHDFTHLSLDMCTVND